MTNRVILVLPQVASIHIEKIGPLSQLSGLILQSYSHMHTIDFRSCGCEKRCVMTQRMCGAPVAKVLKYAVDIAGVASSPGSPYV